MKEIIVLAVTEDEEVKLNVEEGNPDVARLISIYLSGLRNLIESLAEYQQNTYEESKRMVFDVYNEMDRDIRFDQVFGKEQ